MLPAVVAPLLEPVPPLLLEEVPPLLLEEVPPLLLEEVPPLLLEEEVPPLLDVEPPPLEVVPLLLGLPELPDPLELPEDPELPSGLEFAVPPELPHPASATKKTGSARTGTTWKMEYAIFMENLFRVSPVATG